MVVSQDCMRFYPSYLVLFIIVKVSYSVSLALYPYRPPIVFALAFTSRSPSLPLCAPYLIGRFRIPVEFLSSDIQHSSQADILEVFHLPSKTVRTLPRGSRFHTVSGSRWASRWSGRGEGSGVIPDVGRIFIANF